MKAYLWTHRFLTLSINKSMRALDKLNGTKPDFNTDPGTVAVTAFLTVFILMGVILLIITQGS